MQPSRALLGLTVARGGAGLPPCGSSGPDAPGT
jgi:hypothetical protein